MTVRQIPAGTRRWSTSCGRLPRATRTSRPTSRWPTDRRRRRPSSGLVGIGPDGRRRLTFAEWDAAGRPGGGPVRGRGRGPRATSCACSCRRRSTTPRVLPGGGPPRCGHHRREPSARRRPSRRRSRPGSPARGHRRRHRASSRPRQLPPVAGRVVERAALGAGPDAAAPSTAALGPADARGHRVDERVDRRPQGRGLRPPVPGGGGGRHRRPVPSPATAASRRCPSPTSGYMTRPWDEIAHGVTTVHHAPAVERRRTPSR